MEIKAQGVGVRLGGLEILSEIDLTADAGRFIGIIGPNGSGKSTLLKCIYRVLKASEGAVLIDGKALDSYSVKESAKKIGVVAQHCDAGFDFTVMEMTMMGRGPHKKALEQDSSEDCRIALDALGTVGMEAFADRTFSTLSGGERQRVILARALAQQTPVLILDEPTNHLDIKHQLQLMRIVKSSGRTVVSAIHDLNIAARYCDDLYVLSEGRILAHGPPFSILTEKLIWEIYGVHAVFTRDGSNLHIAFTE